MKLILLAFLLTTVACNKEEVIKAANEAAAETPAPTPEPEPEPDPEPTPTEIITERLQGSFSKCVPSPTHAGYYNKMTVNVTDNNYEFWFELHPIGNTTCTSPYYRFRHNYEIEEASYPVDGDDETIDITFKNVSLNVAYNFAWYVGNNYCGLGWVLNVEKDMTGVACTAVAPSDTHHAKFRIAGDLEFHRLVLTDSTLTVPFGYTQSGDAATDRKVSYPTALDKL